METGNADITDSELESLVQSMMCHADLANKETINLQDFQQILSDFNDKFNYVELEFNLPSDGKNNRKLHAGVKTIRSTFIGEVQSTVESMYADPSELKSRIEGRIETEQDAEDSNNKIFDKDEKIVKEMEECSNSDYWYPIMKYLANKRQQVFWTSLYTLFLLGIFGERVYCTFFCYFYRFLTSIFALCYNPQCFCRLLYRTRTFWLETDIRLRPDYNERCGVGYDVHVFHIINYDVS